MGDGGGASSITEWHRRYRDRHERSGEGFVKLRDERIEVSGRVAGVRSVSKRLAFVVVRDSSAYEAGSTHEPKKQAARIDLRGRRKDTPDVS